MPLINLLTHVVFFQFVYVIESNKCSVLYTLLCLLWIISLKPTLRWLASNLDDDNNSINDGYQYFLVSILGGYFDAAASVLHNMFELNEHVRYAIKFDSIATVVDLSSFAVYVTMFISGGNNNDNDNHNNTNPLVVMELIATGIGVVHLSIDLTVTIKNKWCHDIFWKGLVPCSNNTIANDEAKIAKIILVGTQQRQEHDHEQNKAKKNQCYNNNNKKVFGVFSKQQHRCRW